MNGRKRLHISPLDSELLPTVLNSVLLQQASNISFHTIETFPEKNYGYIDLPDMEAEKLKKKLNGSVLRGTKMRVDEARPRKTSMAEGEQDAKETDTKVLRNKKAKVREEGVIPGHELRNRRVKRGWTEPVSGDVKPSKKRKEKDEKRTKKKEASLTGEVECLFKTTLPPNATSDSELKDGKAKKRKRAGSSRDVIVHEFANTTKHANFLRDESGTKGKTSAAEYVEGKGWIDAKGNLVEMEPKGRLRKTKPMEQMVDTTNEESKPRSRRSSRLDPPSVQVTAPKTRRAHDEVVEDETSSSGTSTSVDSESESEDRAAIPSPPKNGTKTRRKLEKKGLGISGTEDDEAPAPQVGRLSITRSSATPPPSQLVAPTSAPAPVSNEIHPLEALFKRPKNAASESLTHKKPNLEVSTSFNFFDPDVEESGSQSTLMPQTPFTQQDIRHRRQRSAAPTPDTAMPGKTFGDVWEGTSDIDDGEVDIDMDDNLHSKASPEIKQEKPESDFSKWFWEHRGETNRAWKRRRREAAKEKRQKDNKERRG
ncbi:hypothetical protein P7C71_g5985, partial [Lecanoromycetidae sp. Uapishka_2]